MIEVKGKKFDYMLIYLNKEINGASVVKFDGGERKEWKASLSDHFLELGSANNNYIYNTSMIDQIVFGMDD